jgi:hypothetical protein
MARSIGFTHPPAREKRSSPRSGFAPGDDLPTYPALQLSYSSRRMLACLPDYREPRRWNRQKHPSKSSAAAASPPRDVLQQLMGREFPLVQACVSVSAAPEHHPMNGKALITQRSAGKCKGRSRFAMERWSERASRRRAAGWIRSDPCSCNEQRAAGIGSAESVSWLREAIPEQISVSGDGEMVARMRAGRQDVWRDTAPGALFFSLCHGAHVRSGWLSMPLPLLCPALPCPTQPLLCHALARPWRETRTRRSGTRALR